MRTTRRVDIPISGMSCASCAVNIEKGLSQLEGVSQANVNFATEKGTIVYRPDLVGEEEFVKTIQELGYDVRLERVTIPIGGMSCASCVERIERVLNDLPGVVQANVNFATEKATVEYFPTQVSLSDMKKAIEEVGYEVRQVEEEVPLEDREKAARQKEIRDLRLKVVVSAILSVPLFLGSFPEWFPWMPDVLNNYLVLFLLATPVQFWAGCKNKFDQDPEKYAEK